MTGVSAGCSLSRTVAVRAALPFGKWSSRWCRKQWPNRRCELAPSCAAQYGRASPD